MTFVTRVRAVTTIAITLFALGCDNKSSATADGGSKPASSASARTTRLDCGGAFASCPPGEYCYYDKPGCAGTGYCGPAEATCVHPVAFCGCSSIELACEFPKRTWLEKGPQCFNEAALNAAPKDASAPTDGGKP